MSELKLSQQQDAVALASQAMTQDKAQTYELVGMLKPLISRKKSRPSGL